MVTVSVIIPVYNSETYLEECLSSVCNQTLSDIEIICIDDGSSDGSLAILRSFCEKDHRIKLIVHDKNAGLLTSWRDGIHLAEGDYIMFLDSDDELRLDACAFLSSKIKQTNVDMYQFGTNVIIENGYEGLRDTYKIFLDPYVRRLSGEKVFEGLFVDRKYSWHVWNKIYRKDVCKQFLSSTTDEYMILVADVFVSFYLTYYSKSSEGTKEKLYNYHVDRGYTGNKTIKKKIEDNYRYSWIIDYLSSFLEREGKLAKYGSILSEPPILSIESNIWNCKYLDSDDREDALLLIRELWGNKGYDDIIERSIRHLNSPLSVLFLVRYYWRYNGLKKTIKRSVCEIRRR